MVFSSQVFLFYFLPVTLLLYYTIPRRGKHLVLTLLSYFFYGWANPLFVVVLLVSTVIDYFCGLALAGRGPVWLARLAGRQHLISQWSRPITAVDGRRRRGVLLLSISSNLSLLGFFKYFNFAVDNLAALSDLLGAPWLRLDVAIRVALPLGISFYTFQSMSYTIDVYRGRATALRQFVDFACYVSMFPQLVAGPIIRFSEIADQLAVRQHTISKCARGAVFISLGLTKKILIANPCGRIADLVFDAESVTMVDAWYGVTAYAFQIYFDFSAYSDLAIGLGLMLGFIFPKNFDSPYRAKSITEFWRRWHISLSSWLRDYLYIPLGGSRRGTLRTYANLAAVMLLGGLWHGASWNFVIWGGLHGALLTLERFNGRQPMYSRLPAAGQIVATFILLLFTWVFFRATDLPSALRFVESMWGINEPRSAAFLLRGVLYQPYYLGTFTLAAIVTWWAPQTWTWSLHLTAKKLWVAVLLFGLSLAVLSTQAYNPFIYFIF